MLVERWVAKLVARLAVNAALWVRSEKNIQDDRPRKKGVANTLMPAKKREKNKKKKQECEFGLGGIETALKETFLTGDFEHSQQFAGCLYKIRKYN